MWRVVKVSDQDTVRLERTNADAWRGVDAVGGEEAAESEEAAWRRTAGSAKLTLPGIGSFLEAPHPIRADPTAVRQPTTRARNCPITVEILSLGT